MQTELSGVWTIYGFRTGLDATVTVCSFVAVALCFAALCSWQRYATSRKLVLLGWFITFASPFIISVVPARMFVSWGRWDQISKPYNADSFKLSRTLAIQYKI